jgi:hypothetical protein
MPETARRMLIYTTDTIIEYRNNLEIETKIKKREIPSRSEV